MAWLKAETAQAHNLSAERHADDDDEGAIKVTIGREDDRNVEIASGLAAGEAIAVSNSSTLKAELGKAEAEHHDRRHDQSHHRVFIRRRWLVVLGCLMASTLGAWLTRVPIDAVPTSPITKCKSIPSHSPSPVERRAGHLSN